MSIFSTLSLTENELKQEILKRITDLNTMSKDRLIEILESMCQYRDYDNRHETDELAYNSFWRL